MNIKIMIMFLCTFGASISMAQVKITYGLSTYQNRRPYQEDRFSHAIIDNGEFFGVYDGHGGSNVSSFLQKNLYGYFEKAQGTIEKRFKTAFEQADYVSQTSWEDGSTAVVAYVDGNNVFHCAWAGDSRAVLEGDGNIALATNDHKPDREDEKKRINSAGGKIVMHGVWRVNGLAVSRSIGDAAYKLMGPGQIIATPEYVQKQLTPDNHFAIIASDGLWDVITSEDAVAIVNEALRDKKSLNVIAKILQNSAIKRGSGDNITVCVMQFDWYPQISTMRKWWNWLWGK